MTQPETARALLHRHGLPEDIIDGALCLHAQELAAQQRNAHDELRPYSHMGLPCKPEYECGARRVIDLIDPTRTPAAVSAAVAPPTQTAPSHRAGLRDRLAAAIWERTPEAEPTRHGLVMGNPHGLADAVLAVLYREWPWLRAEAEEAPADRAAELAKHVTRAIFALKSPPPSGSEHYRSGWDDGLEAAIDAARDELLRRMADETATEQCECGCGQPGELVHGRRLAIPEPAAGARQDGAET